MLIEDIRRYIALRRSLGFKLKEIGKKPGVLRSVRWDQRGTPYPKANGFRWGWGGVNSRCTLPADYGRDPGWRVFLHAEDADPRGPSDPASFSVAPDQVRSLHLHA